jgi:hypothetical protein
MSSIRKTMRTKVFGVTVAATTLAALAIGLTGFSAQASSAKEAPSGVTVTAGGKDQAAPRVASQRAAVPANAPSVSPSVRTIHVATGEPYTCDTGNLCLEVWDPTTSNWKVFYLYNCRKYSLSYFNGWGDFTDYQTGGVRSYFYGQSGNELRSFTPPQLEVPQDWGPVWSVRNC